MKLLDILISANQSLLRNRARTILTVVAIFIGATTLSLTNGIGSGIKAYLTRQLGNLGNSTSLTITVADKGIGLSAQNSGLVAYVPGQKKISLAVGAGGGLSTVAMTQTDITKIAAIPNIVSVEPTYNVLPDYIANNSTPNAKYQFTLVQIIGVSSLDISNGIAASNQVTDNQLTVPDSYVSSLGYSSNAAAVNGKVTIGISNASGVQSTVEATITGIQQKTLIGSTAAYANGALYRALHSIQTVGLPASTQDAYASVAAIYKTGLTDAQVTTLKNQLKADGYNATTVKDRVSTVFTVISAITYVLDGFAAITLLAAAFGIVNTLYMSVSERTREIGLMKALGMGKNKIFLLFSIEAILLGFWGSILGIIVANGIGALINTVSSKGFLKDFTGLQLLSFSGKSSALIVTGIMLIAFLAGTLPARRASQKDPIDALRYE